jgi:predicted transcriptional regulator
LLQLKIKIVLEKQQLDTIFKYIDCEQPNCAIRRPSTAGGGTMNENISADTISAADCRRMTANLVSAYVRRNNVPVSDLPTLITSAADALIGLAGSHAPPAPAESRTTPAKVRSSITHEALISFEDGKGYKTLKRHLTAWGLTPETYRAKWGLPRDYPMVAPGYSERRSAIAKILQSGHGSRLSARTAGKA